MPSNTSTLNTLLKEDYGPSIRNELNDATPELELFETNEEPWEGREKVEPIKVNRNRGAYFTAEGGAPPTAGQIQLEHMRIPMRFQHGGIQVTKQLMTFSRSNKGSWARALRLEMEGMVDTIRQQRRYAINHDGRGVLALINGDPGTGTTITVDAPGGVAGATDGARFINIGDWLTAIDPATGGLYNATAVSRRVTNINAAGSVLTMDAAVDTNLDDNDLLVRAYGDDSTMALADTDWQHPPMGLLGMVDNGTYVNLYFGLSRTTFSVLNSTIISSVGALSADVIQRAIDVTRKVGQAQIKYLLMEDSLVRAYITISEADRRYMGGDLKNPDVGTNAAKAAWDTGLTFGGIPLKRGMDTPYGMIFGIDPQGFVRYVPLEAGWIDDDGSVLFRSTTAVDTFDAQYRCYENFANFYPNKCFRLDGVTSNIVVAHVV